MKGSARKQGTQPQPAVEPSREPRESAAGASGVGSARVASGAMSMAGADQPERLVRALTDALPAVYRLIWWVADEDTLEDSLVEWLGALARHGGDVVPPGRERAWVLRNSLRLLGALVPDEDGEGSELPSLAELPVHSDISVPDAAFVRLHGALRGLGKSERASVVLVVQEGLSLEQGASIQGGSRGAFARRYIVGMSALDDDLVDALMGRESRAAS